MRQEISVFDKDLNLILDVLDDIQNKDDNIYRAIFEADPYPDYKRKLGTGGNPNNTFTIKANPAYDTKTLTDLNNDFIDTLTAVQVPTPAILTAVQIGNIVTSIGNLAFNNCFNLASVTFASISTLTSIGVNAFLNSGLTTVTIANGQLGIPSPAVGVSFFGVTVSTIL